MTLKTCVFDAYGTLFDVTAAAREAAREPRFSSLEAQWPRLAASWRDKQLSYTWLRAVAGAHVDFWQVTQDGLDWALEETGLSGDAALRARLLQLYMDLSAYPEVKPMLEALKAAGHKTAILSNGTPDMLTAATRSAGLETLLDALLSVESVGIFKPSDKVYDLVGETFVGPASNVLFVSSNGWDAASAAAYGFETVWVNRAGNPPDRLHGTPRHIMSDLTEIPRIAAS